MKNFFCFPLQRLPFSVGFIGCMVGTIYVSMVLHSYFLSVIFSVLQVCPSPMQCLTWLYLFKLCYTAENTCFSAFRVLFPITARLEHAAYLNNESMLSWFKGDSHLFYFFHIYFFCLLYLLTFEQYNVMICCCLYLLILLHIPLFGLTQFSLFDPGSGPGILYHILLPRRI